MNSQFGLMHVWAQGDWVTRCVLPSGTSMSACTTALASSAARVKDSLVGLNIVNSLSAKPVCAGWKPTCTQ